MNRSFFRRLGGIALIGLALSGCMSSPTPDAAQPTAAPAPATVVAAPSPAPGQPTAKPGQPTAEPAKPTAKPAATPVPAKPTAKPAPGQPTAAPAPGVPTFSFAPQSGGPGTRIILNGWNFANNKPVVVRLGMPNPLGEVLVSATVDGQGKWAAELVMPDRLPSGDVIPAGSLNLVVMNDANQSLAAAPFAFTPATQPVPPRSAAVQTVRDMLSAHKNGGDIGSFLSADLYVRLINGETLPQILGMSNSALESFDVGQPLDRPADALFIPAQLTFSDLQEAREFTVVLQNNTWKVAGSNRPLGEAPAPTPDGQEWHLALTSDINNDGVMENISYRTGRVKINTPTGFSDPSIVAVVVAQELFVTQGDAPSSRTLLYLNPVALNNENERLLLMGQGNEPNPGFLVIVYGGEQHSLYITPIASDGTPGNQSVRAVWNAELDAYVLG